MTMYLERLQDLSMKYWLEDVVFSGISFVTVVDGYPDNVLELPTVSVDNQDIIPEPWELGNPKLKKNRIWEIDIFAVNKSQRDDFSYRILDFIDNSGNVPVYDYNQGFPPDYSPTQSGCMIVTEVSLTPVRIIPETVEKLYYRANIQITAEYSIF